MYGSHNRIEADGGTEGVGDLTSLVLKKQSKAEIILPKPCNIWLQLSLGFSFCFSVLPSPSVSKLCLSQSSCCYKTLANPGLKQTPGVPMPHSIFPHYLPKQEQLSAVTDIFIPKGETSKMFFLINFYQLIIYLRIFLYY